MMLMATVTFGGLLAVGGWVLLAVAALVLFLLVCHGAYSNGVFYYLFVGQYAVEAACQVLVAVLTGLAEACKAMNE